MPTTDRRHGKPKSKPANLRSPTIAEQLPTCARSWESFRAPPTEIETLRREFLGKQLAALGARVRLLQGEKMTFDQQSQALYDSVAPTYSGGTFSKTNR